MSMWVEMRISNPAQSDRGKAFRLLVDSEAHHSVIPAAEARALGLEAHAIEDFELANGARVRYPVCTALFEHAGKTRGAPLILGEPDVYLVGATDLGSAGPGSRSVPPGTDADAGPVPVTRGA